MHVSIYCLSCKTHTESKDVKQSETTKNRILVRAKCAECGCKKCRFLSAKKGKGIDTPKNNLSEKEGFWAVTNVDS